MDGNKTSLVALYLKLLICLLTANILYLPIIFLNISFYVGWKMAHGQLAIDH